MPLSFEDKAAIQEMAARYNQAIDSGDVDTWLALWTADGVFESPYGIFRGRDELRAFTARWLADYRHPMHWNNNFVIDGAGDAATVSCYLTFWDVRGRPPEGAKLLGVGRYNDSVRKLNGLWKYASRTLILAK